MVVSTLSLWNVAEAGLGASFRPVSHAELGLKVDSLFQTTSENQNLNDALANGVYQAVVQNLDPNNTQLFWDQKVFFTVIGTLPAKGVWGSRQRGFFPAQHLRTSDLACGACRQS
ncbi:MAG: hypothetical protein HKM05_03925 [Spirochaetales bacterium]|nr:hypothetical protein [Spirochaetales bacterium]